MILFHDIESLSLTTGKNREDIQTDILKVVIDY